MKKIILCLTLGLAYGLCLKAYTYHEDVFDHSYSGYGYVCKLIKNLNVKAVTYKLTAEGHKSLSLYTHASIAILKKNSDGSFKTLKSDCLHSYDKILSRTVKYSSGSATIYSVRLAASAENYWGEHGIPLLSCWAHSELWW